MVLNKGVAEYINSDDMPFEKDPLENIARDGQLKAFKHHGFWHSMDSLKNKNDLEALRSKGNAPWKIW